jgi:hypothetical protein
MVRTLFAIGYRQRLPPALRRSAAARPTPLLVKLRASIAAWPSDRSEGHCRKPTISPPLPPQTGWHRRWHVRRPLHCAFPPAPSHQDYHRAQPDRADKDDPKATEPFRLLSKQSDDLPHPSEASASPRKQKKKRHLPAWRKRFHGVRHAGVCLAAAGLSTVHQRTDARLHHLAVISSAWLITNRLARQSQCSLFVLYCIFRACGVAFLPSKAFNLIWRQEEAP